MGGRGKQSSQEALYLLCGPETNHWRQCCRVHSRQKTAGAQNTTSLHHLLALCASAPHGWTAAHAAPVASTLTAYKIHTKYKCQPQLRAQRRKQDDVSLWSPLPHWRKNPDIHRMHCRPLHHDNYTDAVLEVIISTYLTWRVKRIVSSASCNVYRLRANANLLTRPNKQSSCSICKLLKDGLTLFTSIIIQRAHMWAGNVSGCPARLLLILAVKRPLPNVIQMKMSQCLDI